MERKAQSYAEKQVSIENDIVPVVEETEEFTENLKRGERFETNVAKDGILLEGEELDV